MFNSDDNNTYYEDPLQRIERRREKEKEIQQAMDQDVPMADAPIARQRPGEEKRSPRKSELQNYVSPKSVLDKVLNTPVTVAVGELLAVSKEVSHQVQEVIKLKSSKCHGSNYYFPYFSLNTKSQALRAAL